jgi:hypothetical protein
MAKKCGVAIPPSFLIETQIWKYVLIHLDKFLHPYINTKSLYFAANVVAYSYKHKQRTYNLTLWHVRIMFTPPRLSWQAATISLTDSIPLCWWINYVFAYDRLTNIHVNILILLKATCFDFQEVIIRPFSEHKPKLQCWYVHGIRVLQVLQVQDERQIRVQNRYMLKLN